MAQGLLLPLHPCFPLHLLCEHQTPHLELAKRHNTLLVCNIHLQNKEKNYGKTESNMTKNAVRREEERFRFKLDMSQLRCSQVFASNLISGFEPRQNPTCLMYLASLSLTLPSHNNSCLLAKAIPQITFPLAHIDGPIRQSLL